MALGTIITKTLKNGDKRYCAVIRLNGKQVWKTYKKQKLAADWLTKNSNDVADGTYRELKKASFGTYMEHWKSTYLILGTVDEDNNLTAKRLKPSTIRGYRTIIDTLLLPEFKNIQLLAIGPDKPKALESKLMQREKFGNKSAHNALRLLKRIFRDAREDGYLKISPMEDFKMPKFTCKKGRALKPEEAQKFLAKCEGDLKLMVLICLLAGLRRAELLALRWTDIHFDGDFIHVQRSVEWLSRKQDQIEEDKARFVFLPPKYHSIRKVDLSPMLKAELRKSYMQATDKEGLLFQTSAGTPVNPSNFYNRMFLPAVAAAEIGKVKPHDLRHTFGSWKVEQGENILYVSKQMGHKDASITLKVYSHLVKESRLEAAVRTDAMLFQPAATATSTAASTAHVN